MVSAGDRHADGGRNPTVHGGGPSIETAKSPKGKPVGLFHPAYDAVAATYGGNSTNNCSNDGL